MTWKFAVVRHFTFIVMYSLCQADTLWRIRFTRSTLWGSSGAYAHHDTLVRISAG